MIALAGWVVALALAVWVVRQRRDVREFAQLADQQRRRKDTWKQLYESEIARAYGSVRPSDEQPGPVGL